MKVNPPAPTLGSLFDGIGGFPLAATLNGITPLWASEIEKFPMEVTKTRFPDMQHVGDITKLKGGKLPPVDIITGGSPCQDLSVAGRRAGLDGERSGLFMEQIRVTKEMRKADIRRKRPAHLVRPRWLVWENVPGAFSSGEPKGEDFRVVLEEVCRIVDSTISVPRPPSGVWEPAGAILGEGFSLAWRVLDAQYWSVPQRRKRIYLVADFGGETAPQILFEQDRLLGDFAQGEGARQGATPTTGNGTENPSGTCLTPWDVQSKRIHSETGTWPALYSGEAGSGGRGYVATTAGGNETTSTLFAGYGTRWNGNAGAYSGDHFITQPTAFACNQRDEVRDLHDVAAAICSSQQIKQQTLLAIPINTQTATRYIKLGEGTGFGVGEDGDPAYTLQASHSHAVFTNRENCLTPWDTQQQRIITEDGVAPTLAGADGGGGRNPAGLVYTSGVVSKGNGDCFITPERHTALCSGGGQAGQGFPCILTAGFSAGASPTASTIGYQEECAPTLKGSSSGTNMVPSILCINDQGGQRIDLSQDVSGTLRSQEKGHQPLVLYENHGIDSRITGPVSVAPTISARGGTGGNNLPLVHEPDSFCISGNIIDRQAHNGGNHFGFQTDISYTLNTIDRHAILPRPKPYQDVIGSLCRGDEKGVGSQYVSQDKCVLEAHNLIRRLTPLECERLQGFPDFWTLIPDCSDTARYKALGNSVAVPCVVFVLRGIAYFYQLLFAA